jgi:putative ABC transport system permease protein
MMQTLLQDLRYGVRMLRQKPGFTMIAIITLALGIGANTAIFSIVYALLLRPLPFQEPSHLVWIANVGQAGLSGATTRVANYTDWQKTNQSFEELAAYFAFSDYDTYTLTGSGEPERLNGMAVSQNFLGLLGVQPMIGRDFDDEESKWNGKKAALLSHGFWQRRFAADIKIVGQTVILNNQPTTIIGILPPSFDFASVFSPGARIDLLMPFPISPETDRWGNTLSIIGRLKPGITVEKAQAEFDLINQQLKEAHPERGTTFGARMTNLQEQVSGRFRVPLLVLFGAVGCVLLIACTNLANLLLARAVSRRKEIAVRIALGASRSRLIRQLLTESLLLSFGGALIGLPLASFATETIAATQAISLPLLKSVSVDSTALVFTLFVTFLTGLMFGLVPALQISGSDVHEDLKDASRGSSEGKQRTWIRGTLVVSEVALACVLLIGTGLLMKSFLRLLEVDPGFQASHAAAWTIKAGPAYSTTGQRNGFYEELVRKVETVPGVESVGLTDTLPLGRNRSWGVQVKGETYPPGQGPNAFPRIIDPGYIRTMGIPLRAGREFTNLDTSETESVLLINETMANRLLPDRDPIGQQIVVNGTERRVVGIVGNVRHSVLEEEAGSEMYLPVKQTNWTGALECVVRGKLPLESLAPSIRAALQSVDPNLPATEFKSLEQIVSQTVSPRRFVVLLLGGLSLLALVLASLGIYGVISYSVTQRTQEIGIRMALGAQTADVLKLIIGQGIKLTLIGVTLGLFAALAVTRLMANLLYGVSSTDPLTFMLITLLLTAVALLACYIPARRATKVDPMIALRYE